MAEYFYIFICFFVAIFADTFFSTFFGILTPFTALLVFYFSGTKNPYLAAFTGLTAGIVIDVLLYKNFILTALSFILITILSVNWQKKGEIKTVSLHILPGALTGLIYVIGQFLSIPLGELISSPFLLLKLGINAFSCILMAGILLPVIIIFLDYIADIMKFERYLTEH